MRREKLPINLKKTKILCWFRSSWWIDAKLHLLFGAKIQINQTNEVYASLKEISVSIWNATRLFSLRSNLGRSTRLNKILFFRWMFRSIKIQNASSVTWMITYYPHWGKNPLFIQKFPWFDVSKMWILWKMRFQKGEFCEKLGFSKCEFLDKMWIFG